MANYPILILKRDVNGWLKLQRVISGATTMGENSWYAIKPAKEIGHFVVSKFSKDQDFQTSYNLTIGPRQLVCDCPAGCNDKYCRHKKTYHIFVAAEKLNKGWMYCFDTGEWKAPIEPTTEES